MNFTARVVVLALDNVDTDQIIPARFLTTTGKDRLGEALFADWRTDPSFPLNRQQGEILLAGHNFGCGSSREHAVWALQAHGFRAIISTAFADIFRNNAIGNGLLPIQLTDEEQAHLLRLCADAPHAELTIDLVQQTVRTADGWCAVFPVNAFARQCLLTGTDALGYLLAADEAITRYEVDHAR